MGASTENFCLRWNDFETNVSRSFKELRDDSDFFDVTLATSDSGNQTLQAHKVILSACSTFFKQMLRQQTKLHSHPNPFIFLRGVTYNDLLHVLDFMYHGEVNVAQEDLNSFLAVAEELQIKGLTNKDQTGGNNDKLTKFIMGRGKDRGPPAKRARKSSGQNTAEASASSSIHLPSDDLHEVNVKIDPEVTISEADEAVNPEEEGFDESYGDYYDETSVGMEGDGLMSNSLEGTKGRQDISGLMRLDDGGAQCLLCGKSFRQYRSGKRHFIFSHIRPEFAVHCAICNAVAKNERSLAEHMKRYHGGQYQTPKKVTPLEDFNI